LGGVVGLGAFGVRWGSVKIYVGIPPLPPPPPLPTEFCANVPLLLPLNPPHDNRGLGVGPSNSLRYRRQSLASPHRSFLASPPPPVPRGGICSRAGGAPELPAAPPGRPPMAADGSNPRPPRPALAVSTSGTEPGREPSFPPPPPPAPSRPATNSLRRRPTTASAPAVECTPAVPTTELGTNSVRRGWPPAAALPPPA
jgi:hypothetical protein